MFKKIISTLALIFILLIGCVDNSSQSAIKIGIILPLTGGGAEWGNHSKNAYELALKEIRKEYPKLNLQLQFDDSQTDAKTALSIFNRFYSVENIKIVMGLLVSSNVLTIAPIAEENHVLVISNGASNPDISNAGDYIFRTWQSDALEGSADVTYALDSLKWRKIGVVYSENGYGKGLADVFSKEMESRNFEPIMVESFPIGQKNFRNLIAKFDQHTVDGLYIASYPTESAIMLKQLEEAGKYIPILGTQGFDDTQVAEALKYVKSPVHYSIPLPPDTTSGIVSKFINDYQTQYGMMPGITADAAYDALMLGAQAINTVGDDPAKIKDYLYTIRNYQGASGKLSFNKYGDVEKPFVFISN